MVLLKLQRKFQNIFLTKIHPKITIVCFVLLIILPAVIYNLSVILHERWSKSIPDYSHLVACHYKTSGNVIPLANKGFSPPSDSIYFIETSCQGTLSSRQACAVESAARKNPHRKIYVLFASPVNRSSIHKSPLRNLLRYNNVRYARINVTEFAESTPLYNIVIKGDLNRTKWPISHTSDVLRYLVLFKWGGVYLDLDVIVARPLGILSKNFAARENNKTVAAGILAFSRDQTGRYFAKLSLIDLQSNFNGRVWGQNGPGVIKRVLQTACGTSNVMNFSSTRCHGFHVYNGKLFYPIHWTKAKQYFEPGNITNKKVFIYHLWNQKTMKLKVGNDSLYAKLARKYCPNIYKLGTL